MNMTEATLTPENLVKAPGKDGDIFLTRGTPVEAGVPSGSRTLGYVDEGGYQYIAARVGNGKPHPWGVTRIVRVLTEDKPAPVLPRQIKPEDVRVGMVIERRKGETRISGRVKDIGKHYILSSVGALLWDFDLWYKGNGWTLWLIEDAPAPVDPDAVDRQCAWADYRKDYGVGESEMAAAHKAFMSGWKAAREGDQSGPLR